MRNSSTTELPSLEELRVAVIGLGYVGLPLAVEFGKVRPVVGFGRHAGIVGVDVAVEVAQGAHQEFGLELVDYPRAGAYDAIVVAVRHDGIDALRADEMRRFGKEDHVLYDLKNVLPREQSDLRL